MHAQEQSTTSSACAGAITEDMVGDLFKSSEEANLRAIQKFRKILSRDPNPPIDEVIEANIVPRIVGFLRNTTNTTLQVKI